MRIDPPRRLSPTISKFLVAALFFGAVVFIVLSLGAIHGMAGIPGSARAADLPHTRLSGAGARTEPDRPADVGNAQAEEFLRKVNRPAAVPADGTIRLSDETFSAAYDELYNHRDIYFGRTIELAGIVMSQGDLGPGGFLIGRRLLWCCENDAYFIGFLAFTAGTAPEEGDKIRVLGVLEPREYRHPETGKSYKVPAIRVERVDPEPGVSETVYPRM